MTTRSRLPHIVPVRFADDSKPKPSPWTKGTKPTLRPCVRTSKPVILPRPKAYPRAADKLPTKLATDRPKTGQQKSDTPKACPPVADAAVLDVLATDQQVTDAQVSDTQAAEPPAADADAQATEPPAANVDAHAAEPLLTDLPAADLPVTEPPTADADGQAADPLAADPPAADPPEPDPPALALASSAKAADVVATAPKSKQHNCIPQALGRILTIRRRRRRRQVVRSSQQGDQEQYGGSVGVEQCSPVQHLDQQQSSTSQPASKKYFRKAPSIRHQPHCGTQWTTTMAKPKKVVLRRRDPCLDGAIKHLSWANSKKIGEGAFGAIYKVYYRHERAAIKVQENNKLAAQEAKCLRRICPHPNVLQLLAYAQNKKFVVTLSPLAVCDLHQLLCLSGWSVPRLSLRRALVPFIVISIYSAIRHMHRLGYAHRDVKDTNVLILTDGTPVLTDFGMACKFDKSTLECPVVGGEPVGTEGFIPPEVVWGFSRGPAMDLWGLGIITCVCIRETPHEFLNRRFGLKTSDADYSSKSMCRFFSLDLAAIYDLSPEEDAFLSACFTLNTADRVKAVELIMQSEWFDDVNFSAIDCGERLPQWHGKMEALIEVYMLQQDTVGRQAAAAAVEQQTDGTDDTKAAARGLVNAAFNCGAADDGDINDDDDNDDDSDDDDNDNDDYDDDNDDDGMVNDGVADRDDGRCAGDNSTSRDARTRVSTEVKVTELTGRGPWLSA